MSRVAIILSVSAARQIFGDADAVGKTVKLGGPSQLVGAASGSSSASGSSPSFHSRDREER